MNPYVTFWFDDFRDWIVPIGESIEIKSTYLMLNYRAFALAEKDPYEVQLEYNHGDRNYFYKHTTKLYDFQEFVYMPHCFKRFIVYHNTDEYPKFIEMEGVLVVKSKDSDPSLEYISHISYCFPSEKNKATNSTPIRITAKEISEDWCRRNGFETTMKVTRLTDGFIANGNFKDLRGVVQKNQIHWP